MDYATVRSVVSKARRRGTPKASKRGRPRSDLSDKKVLPDYRNYLLRMLQDNADMTLDSMRKSLQLRFGLDIEHVPCKSSLHNCLRDDLLTLKVAYMEPEVRNTEEILEKRAGFVSALLEMAPTDPARLIYLDDLVVATQLRRIKGRSRKGVGIFPRMRKDPCNFKTFNLGLAMTQNQLILSELGTENDSAVLRLTNYLSKLIDGHIIPKNLHQRGKDDRDRETWIILDASKLAMKVDIERALEEKGVSGVVRVRFLPAFSPMLNPLEWALVYVKDLLRRSRIVEWETVVLEFQKVLEQLNSDMCSSFFRRAQNFFNYALEHKPISAESVNWSLISDPSLQLPSQPLLATWYPF